MLSRLPDTAKAFAYLLNRWDALNLYCSNGRAEIVNNIAVHSLIGTCRLNSVDPETWLRYVLGNIQDWPANRVRDLLPWKVSLTA